MYFYITVLLLILVGIPINPHFWLVVFKVDLISESNPGIYQNSLQLSHILTHPTGHPSLFICSL